MLYRLRVGSIPDGSQPKPGLTVVARRIDDGATLATAITDADGFVTFQADGHWPPFYLFVDGQPGGPKYWRSDESHTTGVISPMELPAAVRALGDGVIRGFLGDLAPSVNGTILSLATGTASCAGYPVYNGTADQFTLTRPVTSTRIDRLVAWVRPLGAASAAGEAGFSVRTGVEGAAVTALVQTADLHEVSLATITVPTAGALTLVDTRAFVIEKLSAQEVVRLASITTTSAGGEYLTGLTITLDIPRSGDYTVEATLTGQQLETQVITTWVLQATYGSLGSGDDNFNTPGQVAVDSSGNTYTADTFNNRLIKRNSAGAYVAQITGIDEPVGVAVDSSGGVYVHYRATATEIKLRKYNSAFVVQWTITSLSMAGAAGGHLGTDNTHVYVAGKSGNQTTKYLCSTGAAVLGWGSTGSGNGQFNAPHGIAVGGGEVYVVDAGNSRVQVFNTSGVYQRQWAFSASARGCALDTSGNVLVALFGNDQVNRYTNTGVFIDQLFQTAPDGIAVATGDVVWVTNATDDNLAKWDEASTPGGHGAVAIDIDSVVSDYLGIGNRDGSVSAGATGSKAGGTTVVIRAFGKATASTLTLKGLVLSAKATPQR